MTESTEDRLTRERDEARAEVGRLRERERFLSENGPRLEVKSNLLALPPDELAERFIRLMAANVQHQHNNCRMEKAEVDASMYAAQAIRAESERDTLRATVERLESEAPAARTVTATVSAVLDEYGRDIVEVAKAVLELRATVEAVRAWERASHECPGRPLYHPLREILDGGGS